MTDNIIFNMFNQGARILYSWCLIFKEDLKTNGPAQAKNSKD